MTFGVVLLSILVQGVTVSPLLKALGIAASGAEEPAQNTTREQLLSAKAALESLRSREDEDQDGEIRERYAQVRADIQACLQALSSEEDHH